MENQKIRLFGPHTIRDGKVPSFVGFNNLKKIVSLKGWINHLELNFQFNSHGQVNIFVTKICVKIPRDYVLSLRAKNSKS